MLSSRFDFVNYLNIIVIETIHGWKSLMKPSLFEMYSTIHDALLPSAFYVTRWSVSLVVRVCDMQWEMCFELLTADGVLRCSRSQVIVTSGCKEGKL